MPKEKWNFLSEVRLNLNEANERELKMCAGSESIRAFSKKYEQIKVNYQSFQKLLEIKESKISWAKELFYKNVISHQFHESGIDRLMSNSCLTQTYAIRNHI